MPATLILYAFSGLVLAIVVMAGIELYCRVRWPEMAIEEDIYSDFHWRKPYPYIMFKGYPGYQHLNELGYPGPAPQRPKPGSEFRIILCGGSTVFNGEPSIGGILEVICREHGLAGVRVYNAGVVSSCSGMEMSRILFEFVDREPDLVIFYNGGNDLLGPHYNDPRPGYPPNFVVHESNPILEKDVRKYPLMGLILYSSLLLRYLRGPYFKRKFIALKKLQMEAGYRSKEWEDAIVRTYVDNVVKTGKMLRGFNTRFAVFFQPLLHFKALESISSEEQQYTTREDHRYWRRFRAKTLDVLQASCNAAGIRAVDLSEVFSNNPDWVYTDAIHIRQEMQAVIAGRIFEELKASGLLSE